MGGPRRLLVRGAAALVCLVALTGCGQAALPPVAAPSSTPAATATGTSTPTPSGTPAPEPTPEPTPEPGVIVPLASPRAPADFTGDDAEFVRQVRVILKQDKVSTKMSDSRLVSLGKEFCSVLSGGGLLATKVDHWAGSRDLKQGVDAAILDAARAVLCGDLADGYTRLRVSERSDPTSAERADLARFVTALDQPDLDKLVAAISDPDVAGDAEEACAIDFDGQWWNSRAARKLEGGLPEQGRMAYVVGLVTAYCPEEADPMIDALEEWAD